LVASLVSALLAVFIYEASVVVFIMIYAYWAVATFGKREAVNRRFLGVLIAGTAVIGAVFTTARILVVHVSPQRVPLPIIAKNSLMYVGALLTPFDTVLAHQWFGTPLISEWKLDASNMALWGVAAVAGASALVILLLLWKGRGRLDWPILLLLAGCAAVSLSPFVMYNPRASESYLPLSAGFFSLMLCHVLRSAIPKTGVYAGVIAALAVLFGMATWVRNDRVAACGKTAEAILSQLPLENWRQGDWRIGVDRAPGEPVVTRYGLYNYQGLSTIDVGGDEFLALAPLECALQLATHNKQVKASTRLSGSCTEGTCFSVYNDGRVVPADSSRRSP
jgi:hypothetical protein